MDNETQQTDGQAPAVAAPAQDAGQPTPADSSAEELRRARDEAAKRRVETRELRARLAQVEPLVAEAERLKLAQMSEQEKLAQQLQTVQAQLESEKARAAQAVRMQQFTTIATAAKLPAELLPYLDVSKFDVEDEVATTEQLGKIAKLFTPATSPTNPTNPARQSGSPSADNMRAWLFGGNGGKHTVFGE